jgi:hypothetical protein
MAQFARVDGVDAAKISPPGSASRGDQNLRVSRPEPFLTGPERGRNECLGCGAGKTLAGGFGLFSMLRLLVDVAMEIGAMSGKTKPPAGARKLVEVE